ncbi:nickel pincer cofactor biosynthesis protein LarC [Synechococcus sp. PCC 6312]|uniref:nickel pincer cofactor biosynthesis protein LarC n=1 Tax=Synechococcus sp. (strain ATCC 27167 / PCC 6312) TaxID=195253 RepID=UPI00029F1F75|nr:nickel pincer cofactor biosynthesis protein LarC [Synechococcus sp. PCC 6312]AFY62595.1 hypothetical protein Syn6312_3576 [Synechococcus sp. PCC 6312]
MVNVAYCDCPMGIAGDMVLGAVVDAGVPLAYLQAELGKLGLGDEFTLEIERVTRQGQAGTKAHVHLQDRGHHHHAHPHGRHWPEIVQLIQAAALPPQVTAWSLRIFEQLARAEGAVHGILPEKVHFHEVGAVDAIVDIVGSCLGLDWLGIEAIYCSALPSGGGTVRAAHGILPVPVPAVLQLYQSRQVPIYDNGVQKELVTPTGAAIVVALAEAFGSPPAMEIRKIGLGAGTQDLATPNLFRLWIGQLSPAPGPTEIPYQTDEIIELQTQVDDLSPQAIGYTLDALYQAGAVEVFTQAIMMKKNRPGLLITVLSPLATALACEEVLFRETTTLGIRRQLQSRHILKREIVTITTPYGPMPVKLGYWGQELVTIQPEYEDCAQLAATQQIPWREVHRQAMAAAYARYRD